MKRLSIAFLAISLMVFVSCGDKSKDGVDGVGSGSITAKVDATQVEFEHITGAKALGILTIGGDKGDMVITMLLDGDIQEGTYSGTDLPNMTFTNDGGVTGLLSQSGTLTITKHNETSNKIEGTFDVVFSNYGYTGDVKVKGSFIIEYAEAGI